MFDNEIKKNLMTVSNKNNTNNEKNKFAHTSPGYYYC